MPDSLVLFDIDGTLLNTGGAGIAALRESFAEEFPEQAARMPELDLAGATDSGLVINIFQHAQIENTDENRERYYAAYLQRLSENLASFGGQLLPGVLELLDALAEEPSVSLGLLTGNIERGARIKIDHFGVGHHFEVGSYGDDHHDRDELGPIAIGRAEALFERSFQRDRTYVLGDTAKDIRCARAAGVTAIAVATGGVPHSELQGHEPDVLFEDFADTAEVLRSLGLCG